MSRPSEYERMWRPEVRRAIVAAILAGRERGLEGPDLAAYVEGACPYPDPDRGAPLDRLYREELRAMGLGRPTVEIGQPRRPGLARADREKD